MRFDVYQRRTALTQQERAKGLPYLSLGLTGEAGEVANKVKKVLRDHGGELTEELRNDILEEIGDVLWYAARLVDELGAHLDNVAISNLTKLEKRHGIHGVL